MTKQDTLNKTRSRHWFSQWYKSTNPLEDDIRKAVAVYELVFCRYLILCFAIFGLPTSAAAFVYGVPIIGFGAGLFSLVSWIFYFLLGKTKSVALLSEVYFALTFMMIYGLAWATGGVPGPMSYSFYLIPMMAMVCRGKLSSIIWAVVTVVSVLSLPFLSRNFPYSVLTSPDIDLRSVEAVLMIMTFLSIFLIGLAGRIFTEKTFSRLILEKHQKADLQLQLIQASKLASLGTLGAGVAHELNNPLAAIIGFAKIIKGGAAEGSEEYLMTERIIQASNRMVATVQHLRQFARDSSQETKSLVDFNQVVNDALILFEKQLNFLGITFEISLPSPAVFVWGDPNQLESVIQNLLSNSRDAFQSQKSDGSKKITIKIDQDHDTLCFEYSDNAGGMSEEIMARMFDPFFTTKPPGKGTGLGMSISYDIIQKHLGLLEVNSQLGVGSTFRFSLPIRDHQEEELPQRTKIAESGGEKAPSKLRAEKASILIVDDEPDLLTLLEAVLEEFFSIETHADGPSAVEALKIKHFDYILTDLKMPHFSGIRIIKAAQELQPHAVTIVMSGHAIDSEEAKEALNAGAAKVIAKPLPDPEELYTMILASKNPAGR